jgi:hypothetical protein
MHCTAALSQFRVIDSLPPRIAQQAGISDPKAAAFRRKGLWKVKRSAAPSAPQPRPTGQDWRRLTSADSA